MLHEEKVEKLAALIHDQWAYWTKCMLEALRLRPGSAIVIVKHWWRQINTPYQKLTEKEKDEDRVWARKFLKLLYQMDKES